jgi:hypothetical protein
MREPPAKFCMWAWPAATDSPAVTAASTSPMAPSTWPSPAMLSGVLLRYSATATSSFFAASLSLLANAGAVAAISRSARAVSSAPNAAASPSLTATAAGASAPMSAVPTSALAAPTSANQNSMMHARKTAPRHVAERVQPPHAVQSAQRRHTLAPGERGLHERAFPKQAAHEPLGLQRAGEDHSGVVDDREHRVRRQLRLTCEPSQLGHVERDEGDALGPAASVEQRHPGDQDGSPRRPIALKLAEREVAIGDRSRQPRRAAGRQLLRPAGRCT